MTDFVLKHKSTLRDFIAEHADLVDNNDLEALFGMFKGVTSARPEALPRALREFLESEYGINIYDYIDFIPWNAYIYEDFTDFKCPSHIKEIREYAFCRCAKLKTIELPSSLTRIYTDAFIDCVSLKEIKIPEGVTTIADRTFWDCTGLEHVELPNSLTWIGSKAFSGCTKLKHIDLPNSLTTIRGFAFRDCNSLEEIKIPKSVTYIGDGAFWKCSNIDYLEIPQEFKARVDRIFPDSNIKQINYI